MSDLSKVEKDGYSAFLLGDGAFHTRDPYRYRAAPYTGPITPDVWISPELVPMDAPPERVSTAS